MKGTKLPVKKICPQKKAEKEMGCKLKAVSLGIKGDFWVFKRSKAYLSAKDIKGTPQKVNNLPSRILL